MIFKEKFITSIIAITVSGTALALPFSVSATDMVDKSDTQIIELKDSELISDFCEEQLETAEIIVIDQEAYSNNPIDDLKEVLDNGTDIIITEENDVVASDFETELEFDNSDSKIAGYYVSSNGE